MLLNLCLLLQNFKPLLFGMSVMLVVTLFKAWVLGRLFAGIVGSNPAGNIDACLL
jgi:hypothetical protein